MSSNEKNISAFFSHMNVRTVAVQSSGGKKKGGDHHDQGVIARGKIPKICVPEGFFSKFLASLGKENVNRSGLYLACHTTVNLSVPKGRRRKQGEDRHRKDGA